MAGVLAPERRITRALAGSFAATGLITTVLGLFGRISYLVWRRRREIGIRLALGAPRHVIVLPFVVQGASLALLGVAVGIPGAMAVGRIMGSQLYGVTTTDPRSLFVATVVLLLTAGFAALVPAMRSALLEPRSAFRAE